MIPKHANPFSLLSSTTIVSRSALKDSDDEEEHVETNPEHAQMIARLESILKRNIDDVLPPASHERESTDGASRKKKRRKVAAGEKTGGEEPVAVCTSARAASLEDV